MNTKTGNLVHNAMTLAWIALITATGVGWWLGHTAQSGQENVQLATAGIIVTAFIKVWIVGFQFMELRHAPRWLRHTFDAWALTVCSMLIIICLT